MRKIISIIAALCMLPPLAAALPAAAAETALLDDDFEGYWAYTEHSDFLNALRAKYSFVNEKGRIEVVQGEDKLGEESGILHLYSNDRAKDPYIQDTLDMDETRLVSFDAKIDSTSPWLRVYYREKSEGSSVPHNLLSKARDTAATTVFDKAVENWTPNQWHHVAVVTTVDGGNTLYYSAYIDGEEVLSQETYKNAKGVTYKGVDVRFGIAGGNQENGEYNGYYDNIRIISGEAAGFGDMTTLPQNHNSAVSPDRNAVIFRFGTEVNPSSLDTGTIQVTRSAGGSETVIQPTDVLFTGDALKFTLSDGPLEPGANYTITLPEGVEDVLGHPLPEEKRALHFGTVFAWDVDDFDGTENTVKSGGALVENDTGTFSGVTVDEAHGVSMKCEMTGPVTSKTPYFTMTIPEQNSGILIAEADLMVDNPSLQVQCWTARSNEGFDTELLFDGGTVKVRNPDSSPMTYEPNQWYTVKNVYNFDYVNDKGVREPHVDVYINNKLMASKRFQNTGVTSIPQLRFTLLAPKEGPGAMYLDNFKISKIAFAPKLSALVARNDSGQVLDGTELEAASIDALTIASSNPLNAETVTGDSVKLYKGYGDVEIPAAVSYKAAIRSIAVEPERSLEAGSVYRVVLDSTIADTNGVSIGQDQSGSIRTMVGECGVQNGGFYRNGVVLDHVMGLTAGDVVTFRGEGVNRGGGPRKIWIVTALYNGVGLEKYTLQSIELPPDTSPVEARLEMEQDVTAAHSLRCFVWDGETGVALGEQFMLN